MQRIRQRMVVASLFLLGGLPWVLLLIVGFLWLWQEQWLFHWLGVVLVTSLLSWIAARQFRAMVARPGIPVPLHANPSPNWSSTQQEAWASVELVCRRIEKQRPVLEDWDAYLALFQETVETVARHFHPEQEQPFLEMRIPDLLRIVELLSRDLRVLAAEHVPGSHVVTINDVVKGRKMVGQMQKIYNWYRVAGFAVSPVTAIVNEVRHRVSGDTASLVYREIRLYITTACIRKVGFYAIRLYSGELDFDAGQTDTYLSVESDRDLSRVREREQEMAREPLRIVVAGQTGSGKSSLINVLFGELKAATDVLPTTMQIQPFVLERDGLPDAIIVDSAGYGDSEASASSLPELEGVLDEADLLLLVCAATHAARDADRKFLQLLRHRFREKNRQCPECIVALSQVDRLRPFREWNPPYCLDPPQGKKADHIRTAIEAVARDLSVEVEQVVPLNLADGYNVEESLVPVILRHLPAARRHQYLRCLKSFHEEKYWKDVWRQSRSAGLLMVTSGSNWLKKKWGRGG